MVSTINYIRSGIAGIFNICIVQFLVNLPLGYLYYYSQYSSSNYTTDYTISNPLVMVIMVVGWMVGVFLGILSIKDQNGRLVKGANPPAELQKSSVFMGGLVIYSMYNFGFFYISLILPSDPVSWFGAILFWVINIKFIFVYIEEKKKEEEGLAGEQDAQIKPCTQIKIEGIGFIFIVQYVSYFLFMYLYGKGNVSESVLVFMYLLSWICGIIIGVIYIKKKNGALITDLADGTEGEMQETDKCD